jgi:aminopeptidase N
LLESDRLSTPQKASLLRAIANGHPDLAFDFAVSRMSLVNTLVETSNRAGFVASLGGGSDDPAMPGKITAFATANLPVAARGAAKATVASMAARRMVNARIRADIAKWAKSGS